MKKLVVICLSVLLVISTLSGCSKYLGVKTVTQPSPAVKETARPKENYPVELTEAEVADFDSAFKTEANYGFLLSDYDDVRDVDLYQVFYIGAGLSMPETSSEIAQAYLVASGEDELFCDYTALTTKQIDDFLLSKTGYSLSDMKGNFGWDYIEQYDAYIHLHGDTNYITVTCIGGRSIGENLYEIEYSIKESWADYDGNILTGGTVTVKTSGATIQFVSNSMH